MRSPLPEILVTERISCKPDCVAKRSAVPTVTQPAVNGAVYSGASFCKKM
jgi:hypothetical protein